LTTRSGRLIGILSICAVVLFVWWYIEAEDFSESRVAGQYVFTHDGITQKVTLNRDHTFDQEDSANGIIKHASGTWRVFSSTGHMAFSSSFIDAPEGSRGADEKDVYAIFKNYLGWVSITLDGKKTYKKLFS
jgi:hypothetical protein